mmetsp:Transcript_11799/g.33225  ORF Transcript_11799/g.33225 Transcript_11799/m.33225 type:complete len:1288 (-) Transcript_11799:36-3899(-)
MEEDKEIPQAAWKRKLCDNYPDHSEFQVAMLEGMRLAGLGFRLYKYIGKEADEGRLPIMNPFYKSPAGPRMGVPIGGIGAGTIGRGWCGDFGRWQLFPGFPNYTTVDVDQFSVCIGQDTALEERLAKQYDSKSKMVSQIVEAEQPKKRLSGKPRRNTVKKGKTIPGKATVLCPNKPKNNKFIGFAWNYELTGFQSTYHALYPRAWTVYQEPDPNIKLTCKQLSPVIPNNYKESSYPVGVFVWNIENLYERGQREVSLMFTFQNGTGDENDTKGGHFNMVFVPADNELKGNCVGVEMHHRAPSHARVLNIEKKEKKKSKKKKKKGDEEDDDDVEDDDAYANASVTSAGSTAGRNKDTVVGAFGLSDPLTLAIAAHCEDLEARISYCTKFVTSDFEECENLWKEFRCNGSLSDGERTPPPSKPGESIGAAVCVKVRVPAGGSKEVVFALAWDQPIVRFNSGRGYYKRYTKWFGRTGQNSEPLIVEALKNWKKWDRDIDIWQQSILSDPNLPSWYKQALFNELYYVAEGGSFWTDAPVGGGKKTPVATKEAEAGPSEVPKAKEMEKKGKGKKEKSHSTEPAADAGPNNGWISGGVPPGHNPNIRNLISDSSASFPCGPNTETPVHFQKGLELPYTQKSLSSTQRRCPWYKDAQSSVADKSEEQENSEDSDGAAADTSGLSDSSQSEAPSCGVGGGSGSGSSEGDKESALGKEEEEEYTYENVGRFGYLESLEYLMVNTYDVHFYASWALAMNWPLLELSLQRDFAVFTLVEYQDYWNTLHSNKSAQRKVAGAVPHDLGNPGDDPWYKVNSYNIQPINTWKDLNCKFVLQVYRDFKLTNNRKFLWDCFATCRLAIEYVARFDTDGDGLIENQGFPDQTYDTWSATGASSYTGGLWLTALSALSEICKVLGMPEEAKTYEKVFQKGRANFQAKLWNQSGGYFNYDTSANLQHDSIMTDAMCGQWWARACGLPAIAEEHCIRSTLKNIHRFNVLGFKGGQLGPVNGMRPDGKVDTTCLQSVEVWTGTAYGAASCMLQEGLVEEGFNTARGVVRTTYETIGYQFQTPEAWDADGHYRALSYMRPLAIWGMQYAWENFAKCARPSPDTSYSSTFSSENRIGGGIDPKVWGAPAKGAKNTKKDRKRQLLRDSMKKQGSMPSLYSSVKAQQARDRAAIVRGGTVLHLEEETSETSTDTSLSLPPESPPVVPDNSAAQAVPPGQQGAGESSLLQWLQSDIKLPAGIAAEYAQRLRSDSVGVCSLDDVLYLDADLLSEAGIRPIHRKKIMAWVSSQKKE